MKVLVTGASGFTGIQMIRYLSQKDGLTMTGLVRKTLPLFHGDNFSCVDANLLDRARLFDVLSMVQPDRIIHLAGLNHGSLTELLDVNEAGTKNLLEAAFTANADCQVLVIGSSAAYGYGGYDPVTEDTPLRPLSDYGVSKAAQDILALKQHSDLGRQVSVARPFNLVGPEQPPSFICGRIVQQVVEIENGQRDTLDILETSSRRDFIDVRDAVKGYWAILSHPEFLPLCAGRAFNIGSGITYSISAVISLIEEITGDRYTIRVPEKPPDVPVPFLVSNTTRIRTITGWAPEIPFKESLHDMLDAARDSAVISKNSRLNG
jgi:GDP-4-dehydro-6-deoxy-D-mannose reductase